MSGVAVPGSLETAERPRAVRAHRGVRVAGQRRDERVAPRGRVLPAERTRAPAAAVTRVVADASRSAVTSAEAAAGSSTRPSSGAGEPAHARVGVAERRAQCRASTPRRRCRARRRRRAARVALRRGRVAAAAVPAAGEHCARGELAGHRAGAAHGGEQRLDAAWIEAPASTAVATRGAGGARASPAAGGSPRGRVDATTTSAPGARRARVARPPGSTLGHVDLVGEWCR